MKFLFQVRQVRLMQTNVIKVEHSSICLPRDSKTVRLPRAPKRKRSADFYDAFDAHTLVYDVFWHVDGNRVLLICPPPLNLEFAWRAADFVALPSGQKLAANFVILRSTMTISLENVPKDTKKIELVFDGKAYTARVRENLSHELENSRLMFTMNRNNPLEWIREWALFHRVMHGVDSILVFDNGSTEYTLQDMEQTLGSVDGIKNIIVSSLPQKYGPHDPGVLFYRFWANFLQLSSISIMFRRFGSRAFGILNCDIDELVAPLSTGDIFSVANESRDGLFMLRGIWVESTIASSKAPSAPLPIHTNFTHVLRDFRKRLNADKWVIEPKRDWLQAQNAHPAVHRIRNVAKKYARRAPHGVFFHFKGINTNWKENRSNLRKNVPLTQYQPAELKKMFSDYSKRLKAE